MAKDFDVLSQFHPLIANWFSHQFAEPTGVQVQSWRRIANGEHVLITAPTGSGKTFAAFLWAINQLVTGSFTPGHTSVLYVSPLRALNNDIRRNLLGPLDKLQQNFQQAGVAFPEIRVETRSGDTPPSERERMQRQPPEILITTPESLNLLLSSKGGRSILKSVSTVIIDEVHAVLGEKRGVYLMTAIERLTLLSGEFQRIAISATIDRPKVAAKFIGGFKTAGNPMSATYTPRPVAIVPPITKRRYQISVHFPEIAERQSGDSIWPQLVGEFRNIIHRNRTTLLFANSRRLCEKLALAINSEEESTDVYVHHGSLSREIRQEVEQKLRDGKLKAVIATNSLELGIDIGALDEVILVQSPPSVSSAIQRVGRAGHQVGQTCRGTIFPTHPHDLLEAAVLAPAIINQDMENIEPVYSPLDVLAQVIVAMVGVESWNIDALYAHLTTSYPYRNLSRVQFDLVLNMLDGRYADSKIRELRPQVSIDRIDNSIVARKGALLSVYTSGGVIPDRGYFHLRHNETNSLIGELDEEFVWEASIGQTFALGAQNWRIERITHNDVFVLPGNPKLMATPFWHGEENYRDFHFSQRLGEFLENANERLEDLSFINELERNNVMETSAAEQLVDFLKRQQELTGRDLPHRHHLLLEFVSSGPGGVSGNQLVLHTMWGGRVNRPFALALDAAWEAKFGHRVEIFTSNDCVVLQIPEDVSPVEVLSLVSSSKVEQLLRKRLESSGFFAARFRECAGRALLLPRNRIGQRMPLWMNRLRSQKLMQAVLQYDDFPILLETWRTCLQDEFDMVNLKRVLAELESGAIHWSEAHTISPSPFAQDTSWKQTSEYMYMGDVSVADSASKLRGDLLSQVVFNPDIRPTVAGDIVGQFELKRQRLAPGYSPETPRDLVDWVKERLLIPFAEWERLLQSMQRDHDIDTTQTLESVSARLVKVLPPGTSAPLIVAVESLPRIRFGLYDRIDIIIRPLIIDGILPAESKTVESQGDPDVILSAILSDWLQYYGVINVQFVSQTLGIEPKRLSLAIEDLIDTQKLIAGRLLTGGADGEICDSDNFEILLRLARRAAIPVFESKDIESLPLFLAHHQGVINTGSDIDQLFRCVEQLRCLPAPSVLWESEILPARLHPYSSSWLDTIMQEGDLKWVGLEGHNIAFCFESDLSLLQASAESDVVTSIEEDGTDEVITTEKEDDAAKLFPSPVGRYDFATLLTATKLPPKQLSEQLWSAVWNGRVTNDTFSALRKGIQNRFAVPDMSAEQTRPHGGFHHGRRPTSFSQWRGSLPFAGNWFALPAPEPVADLLETEERTKERARILLDRYGILFRELLERESPAFRWSKVFRALRLMELSGEMLSGYFFNGIPGPQFISHEAFQSLQRRLPDDRIYWLNAADPASFCGIKLDSIKTELPRRLVTTHIVYHGTHLVVVSKRNGQELTFHVPPDDPDLPQYFGFLHHLLSRSFQPLSRVTINTVNGEVAARSSFVAAFRANFHVVADYKNVMLYRLQSATTS